jgi:glycosyltransferase involved in cell wall biosynthesis
MMPYIRALAPSVKIIFRCHIEVRTDLLADPESPVSQVWKYLHSFARHADLFVFHPVSYFIPKEISRDRCVVMAPTSDPLDGLNKPLAPADISFYLRMLNRIAYDQSHRRLDLPSGRGYICQIARFDPSKGIDELLESYRLFRERLRARKWPFEKTPQLLITGHGAS